jgi:hypothetical protein
VNLNRWRKPLPPAQIMDQTSPFVLFCTTKVQTSNNATAIDVYFASGFV